MQFSIECQCAGSALSPGQPGCMPVAGRDKFPIYMHYTDSDGNLNGITAGTVLDEAFLIAKLNETDKTKAWYVFPTMYNLESPAPENETEEGDGIPFSTGEQIKQPVLFEHWAEEANPALKAAYDSIKCFDLGVIYGTYKGQLNGMNDGLGNLISIHIQGSTLSAQYTPPAKGVVQKMMVTLLVEELENDANRDYIASDDIAFPTKQWFTKQPLEIIPLEISSLLAAATFTLDSLYGGVARKQPIEGILTADISPDLGITTGEAYNFTQAANEPGALVESGVTPGLYVFTYTLPIIAGDVIYIDVFLSGYGMRTLKLTPAV